MTRSHKPAQLPSLYEAETIPGLESFVLDELRGELGADIAGAKLARAGFIRFGYRGRMQDLRRLRSVVAVYQVHSFLIPRPKAFLGHQHFTRLSALLAGMAGSFARPAQALGIGAAGSGSAVMRRLHHALSAQLKLKAADQDKGDLFLRLLPNREAKAWEALIRISPQPLSARAYRHVNMPGSLNATVAYAMTRVDPPADQARVVNLCSGASTILIELSLLGGRQQLVAIDHSPQALSAGRRNADASGSGARIQHIQADATRTPLPPKSADALYADLPFGHHVGSHEENTRLYPAILREADRLATADAAFIALTHEVKLLRRCLSDSPWQPISETRINLRGLHPRLFVLRRKSTRI